MAKTIRSLSFDAKKKDKDYKRQQFQANKSAERDFYRALKKVAQKSGHIVDIHADGAKLRDEKAMMETLERYSKQLGPWAERQSMRMLDRVSRANQKAYKEQSKKIGALLKSNMAMTDSFDVGFALLHEQVGLIQSIPLEAGLRAQKIAAENFFQGRRAQPDQSVIDQLKNEMGMSTEVAVNRAKLIARTETARANASFVQARAAAIGAQEYIWRTTMDGAERESHAKMNGKRIRYDKPPTLSDGTVGHAGTFPNCRCYQEPVLPEDVE